MRTVFKFNANETELEFSYRTEDDTDAEHGESVRLSFGTLPPGVTASGTTMTTITIIDDDPPVTVEFDSTTYSVAESKSVTVTVTLSEDPKRTLTTPLTNTAQGSTTADDYTVSAQVTFASGQTSRTVSFSAVQDSTADHGDSVHQVIVAAHATNQTSDKRQAVAMVEEAIDNIGAVPKEVSADAGYYSAQALEGLYGLSVAPFVAPDPTRHGRVVTPGAPRSHTRSAVSQGPDATEASDQASSATLRPTDADGGAGIRPDQAGPRLPPVPAAGSGEGQRRMVADLHRPQPAQSWGGSASRNTDQRICRKCPKYRRGGQHSETYESIGPSMAAPGINSCRRLT